MPIAVLLCVAIAAGELGLAQIAEPEAADELRLLRAEFRHSYDAARAGAASSVDSAARLAYPLYPLFVTRALHGIASIPY
jgi:hypothetical protein